jgi:hypothetical protein
MEKILSAILELLLPLRGLHSPQRIKMLLEQLGYALPPGILPPGSPVDFPVTMSQSLQVAARLRTAATWPDRLAALQDAESLVRLVWEGVTSLQNALTSAFERVPQFLSKTAFRETFPGRLLDYLIIQHLRKTAPGACSILELVGLISATPQAVNAGAFKSECTLYRLHFDRIQRLMESPRSLANELYRWDSDFDSDLCLDKLSEVMLAFGLPGNLLPDDSPTYTRPADPAEASRRLFMPLLSGGSWPATYWQFGVQVEGAQASGNLKRGLALVPYGKGALAASVPLGDHLKVALEVGGGLDDGIGIFLRPPAELEVQKDLFSHPARSGDAQVSLTLTCSGDSGEVVLLGSPEQSHLAAHEVRLEGGVAVTSGAGDLYLELALPDWSFVLSSGEGDSFIKEMLAAAPLEIDGSLRLGFSLSKGFYLDTAAGLSLLIPLGKTVGPIHVDHLALSLLLESTALQLQTTVTGGVTLGPFALVLEDTGLVTGLDWDADGGLLGGVDVSTRFKPPGRVGVAIAAGFVSGGGFLSIDAEKGQYAGVGEVSVLGVGVSAVGLLTTRLPGGADGWSMFLSLSATFKGLQIGFGFTLNGVGGLIGVHRGLDEEALAEGVRSGALESLLFPEDVVANGSRILADMGAVFPPAQGQFVFGPVCKLGWGTPTLIEGELGLVLQLPEPLTLTLLGAIEAVLPSEDTPILQLGVDVAGTLNFTEGTLKVDSSLSDSRLAGFALSGDMAIRASFVDDPSFLFSFGGFHPAFARPQGFPRLEKLAIGLDTGDNLRVSLGSYFAITSSTLQFGASCEIWAKAVGFTVEGGTSFDALIVFKPFGFDISIKAWVSVCVRDKELFAVLLAARLQGPNPWYVAGQATFKLLGFRKSLDVEARFGSREAEAPREVIDVEVLLRDALRDPGAWSAVPPTSGTSGVVLAETEADALRVHPAGAVQIRQRLVPLGRRIDHYGNAALKGASQFSLTAPTIGPIAMTGVDVDDWFAAAQYWRLDEEERLAAPSFESMPAGLRLQGGAVTAGPRVTLTADYEVKYRDPAVRRGRSAGRGRVAAARALT